MRALVYHGPGNKAWEEAARPKLVEDTDAIVRVDTVTICGTDLHILKGDVPEVTDGRILSRHGRGGRLGGEDGAPGRPSACLVHHRVR
jgi:alcohol dehydrogenase